MNTRTSLTYIKFLHLMQAVNDLPQFPSLDPVEEKLLSYFALAWHSDRKLTVLETMHGLPDFSSSTVRRRLKSLHQKRLIDLEVNQIDHRIKYIIPTELTNAYFTQLGQCLVKAIDA